MSYKKIAGLVIESRQQNQLPLAHAFSKRGFVVMDTDDQEPIDGRELVDLVIVPATKRGEKMISISIGVQVSRKNTNFAFAHSKLEKFKGRKEWSNLYYTVLGCKERDNEKMFFLMIPTEKLELFIFSATKNQDPHLSKRQGSNGEDYYVIYPPALSRFDGVVCADNIDDLAENFTLRNFVVTKETVKLEKPITAPDGTVITERVRISHTPGVFFPIPDVTKN